MANKETRIFTTDTLETLRQKTNDIALNLGDNEQFNASLSDKTFNYNNVSAGDTLFTGLDVLNKTQQFNIKTEQTLDNTGGYIILTGSPSITGFVADAILTQAGGYSATIVSASTDKILVKNSSGTFSSSENLVVGGDSIAASAVVRIIGEAFHIGVVRVYVNNTEISQNLLSGGFHVANYSANIPLLNSPTVTAFTEGSTVYQGSNLASATFSGTVLSASATDLKLKNHTGSFSASAVIKIDGSSSTITGANHSGLTSINTTVGNAIVLNTPATLNDDIKVYSPSLVDAVNELQDDVGITENLTTVSGNLVGAVNEIEAVFDASTHEISAGSTAFNVTSGEFTIDSSADIVLDADGGNVELKDAGVQYGSLTNTSGNVIVKSGTTTMLTGAGASATFAEDVTVTRDVDIDRNLNVDGTTELNSNLGVDGNFRVGSSNTSKFDVAADTGNTQIDGTLEVDGTAGIDGDLRVGTNKFNVTASSGNTQIDGTLEVDGTAGVDGNFRVGSSGGDKFNVTAASGNTQIDGTLNVDSTTTLNGTTIDGNLDLNGSVDVSTNATIHGVLDVDGVSNLDVVDIDGAVDMASTLQVDGNTTIDGVLDIGQLNTLFTNRNDVKLALNELHTEVGSAQIGLVSGLAAYGQSNMTNAINIIDAEIGNVAAYESGTYGSTTISGVLTNLQTGMISNDTDITNLFADVGSLALVDNLPADYIYTVTDLTTATNTMSGFIGNTSIADIGTTDTVTGALQKLHAEIGDSVLTVFSAPNRNISGALRELEAEKVYLTSSSQQEIASKLGLTGNVTFKDGGSNRNKMTFNSGTTLDLSNASLLLPGNSSNVNIFSASFLEVDGNVQVQGFSVDRGHVITLTDKTDVRLQWNESHADGTSTTKPARSWQFVGLDDAAASHTTDIVTFYNAKELITNNTESGINVTWDASSETFDFNVNDPTVELSGDVVGSAVMTNLGSINISTTIQPNSVALTTDTTGDYVRTVTGTTNQITVSGAGTEGRAATFSIPTDFRAPGTVKILGTTASGSTSTGALTVAGGVGIGEDLYVAGDLYVEGNRVELNVSTLEVEDSIIVTNSLNASVGQFGLGVNNSSGNIDHSLYYNYTNNQWEADGVRILDDVNSILTPQVKTNSGSGAGNLTITDITGARDLNFIDGTGIDVRGVLSGNDINITITNADKGSDQAIFKNITASAGGTATANINNDTLSLLGGSQINTTRLNDTITFDHADTSTLNGTYGQAGAEDGTYIKSVTVDSNGHLTGVTTDDFDDRYDNYGSWQLWVNDVSQEPITSGERLGFDQGGGIVISNDGNDLTISHADTSSFGGYTSTGDSTLTTMSFVRDISLGVDTYGHVTSGGVTQGTFTLGDGVTTVTAGSGITLGGDTNWSANQTAASTFSVSHADTSSVVDHSNDNSGNTVIQDLSVTFDTFGHVTGISTTDVTINTVTNAAKLYTTATNSVGPYYLSMAGAYGNDYQDHYTDANLSYNASTNVLSAGTFSGALSGNASTATTAGYATSAGSAGSATTAGYATSAGSAGSATTAGYATTAGSALNFMSTSHNGSYWLTNNWDGTYWDITSNHGSGVKVAYATNAGSVPAAVIDARIGNGYIYGRTSGLGLSGSMDATANQGGNTTFTVTSNATTASTANTIAYRDSGGDIHARLFRSEYDATNASIGYIMTQVDTVSDNYMRPSTPAQVRVGLGLANSATTGHSSANTGGLIVSRDGSGNFSAGVITASLSGTASNANNVYTTQTPGTAGIHYPTFVSVNSSGYKSLKYDPGMMYDPSTNLLGDVNFNFKGNVSLCTGYAYSNLTGLPTIPTQTSQLTNNSGFVTSSGFVNGNALSATTGTFSSTITSAGDIIAYYSSDERLKDNVQVIDGALEKVSKLRGVEFDWNDKQDVYEGHDIGVIAQDVEVVAPELVQTREDGFKAVKYEKLTALLIEAVKELKEENKSIRAELEILKSINT
jgi:hypothetical protein